MWLAGLVGYGVCTVQGMNTDVPLTDDRCGNVLGLSWNPTAMVAIRGVDDGWLMEDTNTIVSESGLRGRWLDGGWPIDQLAL